MKGPFSKKDLLREMEKAGVPEKIRESIKKAESERGKYFFSYEEGIFSLKGSEVLIKK